MSTMSRARLLAFLVAGLLGGCGSPDDEDLRRAAMRSEPEYVQRLLDGGADPNYVRGGWSILMRVARDGRADVAEILIAQGAKIDFKGKVGASALTIAAEHGNLSVLRVLLDRGADIDIRNDHGKSALVYAAEYGHREIVMALLAAGADVTLRDADGETALMTARRRARQSIADVLTAAGARQ